MFERNLNIQHTCMFEYMTLYRKNLAPGFKANVSDKIY
jgi:hypothetical protein